MIENKQAVILYSGGTDSSAVVCLKANKYEKLHLISYKRFGIFNIENTDKNVEKIYTLFGKEKFVRQIFDVSKIYKLVSYNDYFYYLKKYGLFNLSICGLCKLSMHIRTIIYCLENNIYKVFDGANKYSGNSLAVDQIKEFVDTIKHLYTKFNISYETPIYDLKAPKHITWEIKFGLSEETKSPDITTGTILKQYGFFDEDNVKGTKKDKKMQPRCFQQFLQNIALHYYYISKNDEQKFKNKIRDFFEEKVNNITLYLSEYIENKKNSKIYKYIYL